MDYETRYIKSIDDIFNLGAETGHTFHVHGPATKIIHSSGTGGGLYVQKTFIKKYFGTQEPIKVKFYRQKRAIYITESGWWIYGEWLYDRDEKKNLITLPAELFEI